MKKLALILYMVILYFGSYAQTTIKPTIGLNFTDLSKDNNTGEFKAKPGFQIGGSIAFGKKLYIEPGVFYVGKSTEFVSSDTEEQPDIQANINGIRVPVAIGLNLIGNEKTTVSVRGFGGFSAFFLTGTNDDLNKDDLEKTNFGVFAGAGLDFWKLFVDLSYEWSLTNIQKNVEDIDLGKTRSVFINAGIRINL